MEYSVNDLPPENLAETIAVYKKLTTAHRYLAELKGIASTIPNQSILINTLALQEAKDSSAIENIITTQDELYKAQLFEDFFSNASAKEVSNYAEALKRGFELVRNSRLLTINYILEIQRLLEHNDAGFRKMPGTTLINQSTGETVYVPPQNHQRIVKLMNNLELYINDSQMHNVDPLVKMAVIHFQFESIHPFYDGNGRTGRIINILYLILQGLLNLPVLYLSRYIICNKTDYYRLLQQVRDTGEWENWVLYMLDAVEQTSKETIKLVGNIKDLMMDYKHRIRAQLPKIYSQDLLNNLFRHPYTKIEFVMNELQISRLTAAKYLERLVAKGFLVKAKIWRSNFYINTPLYNLFKGESDADYLSPRIITQNPTL